MLSPHEQDEEESPTLREQPSGKWLIAVDRGARLIEAAIERLEAGGDVAVALEDLRRAHRLVNRGE
ncbi:MAG: hypothetical protein JOZ69_20900 [Myxococcales bacterium]|nr:hypothetical protein [Myxococcales bacterium]